MKLRFVDWIWHVRGSLPLASGQSSDEVFAELDPLFRVPGTSHDRSGDAMVFRKRDQSAQDKMSIFDGGTLKVDRWAGGSVLRYDLSSRALLFCFLAPLLFLGFGQLTVFVGNLDTPAKEARDKAKKADKKPELKLNPIDKALGAPEPEKPGKKGKDKDDEKDKKPSPTPAYVFAGIFATLYLVGRVLEDRLIRAVFRKRLRADQSVASTSVPAS